MAAIEFIGSIVAESDPPGLSRPRWLEAISEHPDLAPPKPREGINPFTKQPMMVRPRHDASIMVHGQEAGCMTWAKGGMNEVQVFGDPKIVGPIAQNVAARLGGRFEPDALRSRTV